MKIEEVEMPRYRNLGLLKGISVIMLSLALTVGLCPIAYAESVDNSVEPTISDSVNSESENGNYEQGGGSSDQGAEVGAEPEIGLDEVGDSGAVEASGEESNDPQDESANGESNVEIVIDELDNANDAEVEPLAALYSVDFEGTEGTSMKVSVPNANQLVSSGKADSVKLTATMNYGGKITRHVEASIALKDIASSGFTTVDFETYGKFSVKAVFLKGKKVVHSDESLELGVVADHYNIAPVSATYPLTLFSLSLWDMKQDADGNEVPTIIMFERPDAYNWDNLPEGVYAMPYLGEDEIRTVVDGPGDSFSDMAYTFIDRCPIFADYVGDLYEMNPDAQFDFWFVDCYVGIAQSFIYANGIPAGQYSMTIMSDGTWTYGKYSSLYKGADPFGKHESLIASWNRAKNNAYANGVVDPGYGVDKCASSFLAAVDSEDNARFWLSRKDLLACGNEAFDANTQGNQKISQMNIASMLSSLQNRGDAVVAEFKSLYGFNDEYFADAEAAGKQVMLVLGTRVKSESNFSDYARFLKTYYGDDFAYYYKGHPGTPTNLYPEKQEQLKNIGMGDVDSSIAAELILFFYPNASVSGYGSSTFTSVEDGRMLFGYSKKAALSVGSPDYSIMDGFVSPVDGNTDASISALCDMKKSNYLVELSDEAMKTSDHDFALWNATDGTLKYYSYGKDGKPVLVRESQGSKTDFKEGLFTIGSSLQSGKLIDIKGGSISSGANVQIFGSNQTSAQRYRFEELDGGFYKIVNVKSGMVLDVQNAGKTKGTNVQQFKWNNTDAQKWRVIPAGEKGSYYIESKCNGLYLDVSNGKSSNGTNIQVWTKNGTKAQKFSLVSIEPVLPNDTYTIKTALGSSKVLDVSNASKVDKANVQIFQSNKTSAQKIALKYNAKTGYYTCTFECSGRLMDVAGGKTSDKTNVWQYKNNGTWAQQWSIVPDGNGYRIVSALSGKALDVANGKTSNGTNVWTYRVNGTKAQLWMIEKAR